MGVTVDGNNIVMTGTWTIVNGFDPSTGVVYLVGTPDGGTGGLPFGTQGASGLSPTLSFVYEEVDPDDPLPETNPELVSYVEGGAGQRSVYNYKLYTHKGDKGDSSTFNFLAAQDLTGAVLDEYVVAKKTGSGQVYFIPQRVGDQYIGSPVSTSGSSQGRRLASVNIPAQKFDWRPRVFATTTVSGTANTRVNLYARVGDELTGHQVGFAKGIAGVTPPPLVMIPGAPSGSDIPGSYGRIAAGATTTIYLRAEQQASTSDSWATLDTDTTFWVEVAPLLPYVTGS